MVVQSVVSMIRHAKQTRSLYDVMLDAGYTDAEFHVWWFSPARDGGIAKGGGKGAELLGDAGETGEVRSEVETYEDVPPKTPVPKEGGSGRPPLPAASSSKQHQPPGASITNLQQAPAEFTNAEPSLLKERAITEARAFNANKSARNDYL